MSIIKRTYDGKFSYIGLNADTLHPELANRKGWILAGYMEKNGEFKKPPRHIDGSILDKGQNVEDVVSMDIKTILAAYNSNHKGVIGVGFKHSCLPDGLVVGDLDKCRNPETGELNEVAIALIGNLYTYVEVSISGRGIRWLSRGKGLDGVKYTIKHDGHEHSCEYYTNAHKGYTTFTGEVLDNNPIAEGDDVLKAFLLGFNAMPVETPQKAQEAKTEQAKKQSKHRGVESDSDLLEKAFGAKNGGKIRSLYESGDDGTDRSSVAMSLCSHLAFYAQDDAQLARVVGESPYLRNSDYDSRRVARDAIKAFNARTGSYKGNNVVDIKPKSKKSGGDDQEEVYGKPNTRGITELDDKDAEAQRVQALGLQVNDKTGMVINNQYNLQVILENDKQYANLIGYNKFNLMIEKLRDTEYETSKNYWNADKGLDEAYLRSHLNRYYNISTQREHIDNALTIVAMKNQYHPVVDYLEGLEWDKKPRVEELFQSYVKGKATDVRYLKDVARCFMISLVARAYQPGCKVDTMPILFGEQGILKSTFFKTLVGKDWFSDAPITIGDKDSYLKMTGKWLLEFAELDTMWKAEQTAIKQFMSTAVDNFRPPYGRLSEDFPRQCVFCGTTNSPDIFKDQTGSRRFWPIEAISIDNEKVELDKDQLWAEAVALYKSGVVWWLDDKAEYVIDEREKFTVKSAWHDAIMEFMVGRSEASSDEILKHLGVEVSQMNDGHRAKIGAILRSEGWEHKQFRKSKGDVGGPARKWSKKKESKTEAVVVEDAWEF